MVSRSRSRSRSASRKTRSASRKTRSVSRRSSRRTMRSKSPRKMRSKSPRMSRRMSRRSRRSGSRKSRTLSEYQKWVKAHKAQITAAVKAAGHTGKNFIKYYAKTAKKMAMEAGVQTKPKAPGMRKRTSSMRKRRVSAVRRMRMGGMSQSAEQKLRALFSRTPSRYTLTKRGSRAVLRRTRKGKAPKMTKSGKPRRSRPASARNMWIKQHAGEIRAEVARSGMAGRGAFMTVANQMYKASM